MCHLSWAPGSDPLTPWANFSKFQVGGLEHLPPDNILTAGRCAQPHGRVVGVLWPGSALSTGRC